MKSITPFFLLLILFGCKSINKHKTYCGKVIWENATFNPNTNLFVSTNFSNQSVLFKDSTFIDQIVTSTWDSTGVLYAYDYMYKYIDLPKQQCALYSRLSDTAKCKDIFELQDSSDRRRLGFTFFINYPQQYFISKYYPYTDTIISNEVYSRIMDTAVAIKYNKTFKYINIGYINCKRKNLYIQHDKVLNK